MYLPEPVVFCINLFYLFHRHGFCQVSRLVHIETFLDGSVVGDELEDDGDREYGEFVIFLRDADDHIGDSLVDSGIFRDKEYHISTSRFTSRMFEMVFAKMCFWVAIAITGHGL